MRFFIEISYLGTNYHGWQIQENARTVQNEVDKAISLILKSEIKTTGSGRTDTGVHALSQVAHFDFDEKIDSSFLYRVNSLLDNDISINSLHEVKNNISARYDALEREYIYKINSIKSPFLSKRSLYYPRTINIKLINEACNILLLHNDFKSFSKVKTDVKNFNCQIFKAELVSEGKNYRFIISSNRFLRGMVRTIVGTLLQLNEGKLDIKDFENILVGKNRKLAGPSAPAYALYLSNVTYSKTIYNE